MRPEGPAGSLPWPRLLRWLLVLVALHSYAVGLFLLFATEWGAIRNLNHKGTKTQRDI